MTDLRCPAKLQAVLHDDGVLEVRCKKSRCGAGPGVIVIHRFQLPAGDLIDTRKHRDPLERKEKTDGTDRRSVPLRAS